jgi:ATP-dependent exoDNAse (exonuclease V) beta subunit
VKQRNHTVQRLFDRQELPENIIMEMPTPKGRHYITPFGVFPSVTNVLSKAEEKPYLKEWRERVGDEEADRVTNEALNRGTKVHDLFERYLRGQEIAFNHPTLKEHFFQAKQILDSIETVYANEIPLFSRHLKVAGRCDCIARINGSIQIVDFKTSKQAKADDQIHNYKMQCAAYAFMANELYGLKINKFSVIISNMYENKSTVFEDDARLYIKDFWLLRKKFDHLETA